MQETSENVFQIGSKWLQVDRTTVGWENTLLTNKITQPNKIRYSVSAIELEQWSIGTKYLIELQNDQDKTFSIPFKAYLGIGRNKKYDLFNEVIDLLMDYFFSQQWNALTQRWIDGETLTVGKFEIGPKGISKQYQTHEVFIPFDEMLALERYDHVLLNSTIDQKLFMKLDFQQDWNWPLISKMLKHLAIWK